MQETDKWFSKEKGYGFVTGTGSKDSDTITFEELIEKSPRAINIKSITGKLLKPVRRTAHYFLGRYIDRAVEYTLFRLWLFFHESPYDKVGEAYRNGGRYYNNFLSVCFKNGLLPAILEMQQIGSHEAIGFIIDPMGDSFFAFDTLQDAESWSAEGEFPNDRAIIPLYGIVANNLIDLFCDDGCSGQIPN